MVNLTFESEINTTVNKLLDVMWESDSCKNWAGAVYDDPEILDTDNWILAGTQIIGANTDKEGMIGTIGMRAVGRNKGLLFIFLQYSVFPTSKNPYPVELHFSVDIIRKDEKHWNDFFPKALALLKELAEK